MSRRTSTRKHLPSQRVPEAITVQSTKKSRPASTIEASALVEQGQEQSREEIEYNAARKEVEEVMRSLQDPVVLRYNCRVESCGNHGRTCFPMEGIGHFTLIGDDIIRWNTAIENGTCSLDAPPADVLASILARHFKEAREDEARQTSTHRPRQAIINIYNGPPKENGAKDMPRSSSPPRMEGSDLANLAEYLEWLVTQGHVSRAHHTELVAILKQHGWGFEGLYYITREEWVEMGVRPGVAFTAVQRQKAWVDEKRIRALALQSVNKKRKLEEKGGDTGFVKTED